MSRAVLLDAAPLGLLAAPPRKPAARACAVWLAGLMNVGARIIVPEITDYEVRRELIRAGKTRSVKRLDALAQATEYLPITTAAMRRAAGHFHGRPSLAPDAPERPRWTWLRLIPALAGVALLVVVIGWWSGSSDMTYLATPGQDSDVDTVRASAPR